MQLGTSEGITREKGHSVSLPRVHGALFLRLLAARTPSPLGWLVSLLHGRMTTENTRRKGQRAQTERISPLVRDLQNFPYLSSRALVALRRGENRSAMKTRAICEYRLCTIAVSASQFPSMALDVRIPLAVAEN